jgi:hypothetical protein
LLQLAATVRVIVEPEAMAAAIVQMATIVKHQMVVAMKLQVPLASCLQQAWVRVWPKEANVRVN